MRLITFDDDSFSSSSSSISSLSVISVSRDLLSKDLVVFVGFGGAFFGAGFFFCTGSSSSSLSDFSSPSLSLWICLFDFWQAG